SRRPHEHGWAAQRPAVLQGAEAVAGSEHHGRADHRHVVRGKGGAGARTVQAAQLRDAAAGRFRTSRPKGVEGTGEPRLRPAPSPRRGEGWGEGVTTSRGWFPLPPTLSPMGRGSPAVPPSHSVLTKVCIDKNEVRATHPPASEYTPRSDRSPLR